MTFSFRDWLQNRIGILIRGDSPRASIKFASDYFKDKKVDAVEIGVSKGYNAYSICYNLNLNKLYLIDPYEEYEDYNDNHDNMIKSEKKAKYMLKDFDNIIWIRDKSDNVLNKIPMSDFIYIDGNHDYKFVKRDINNYWNKLKKGGIIAGHDIESGLVKDNEGVCKAVIEFVKEKDLELNIHAPDWWIIKC